MRISDFVTNVFLAFILFVPCSLYGQVTFETHDQYLIGPTPYALKAADFNNDGWMDMVSANFTSTSPKHVSVLMNNTLGGFNVSNLTAAGSYADLEIADFNKDGNLDFVAASSSDQITIFIGNGDGTFSFTNLTAGDAPRDVLAGDFN
ncbi:MAG: VCBS repeat-containing protein, partial [Cyclobacteriaceae bacterium]